MTTTDDSQPALSDGAAGVLAGLQEVLASPDAVAALLSVLLVECKRCNGDCWIVHPRWAAYWEAHKAARDAYEAAHPGGRWFGSHEETLFDAEHRPEGVESEDLECPDCNGTGSKLTEAGQLLAGWLRNYAR